MDIDLILSSPVLAAIITGLVLLIGYFMWQKRRVETTSTVDQDTTNVDIDVASMVKSTLDLLKETAKQVKQNQECAAAQLELERRIISLEAEADKYEDVRRHNRRLERAVTALRKRVVELEKYITAQGHSIPPDTHLKDLEDTEA